MKPLCGPPKLTEKQAEELSELVIGAMLAKLMGKLPPGTELIIRKVKPDDPAP